MIGNGGETGGIFSGGREAIKHLFAWLFSMGIFLLCERYIDPSVCHSVRTPLDDLIVFSEFFVVFYVLWYFLILGSLLWLAAYSRGGFCRFLKFMTVCQIIAVVIFLIWPNKQDLRPRVIVGDNIFASVVRLIHSVDTNTNVCPSLHVCYSIALVSVWMREGRRALTKIIYVVLAVLISLSTVFIKQHSILDIVVAIPVSFAAEVVTYPEFWKERFTKRRVNV